MCILDLDHALQQNKIYCMKDNIDILGADPVDMRRLEAAWIGINKRIRRK